MDERRMRQIVAMVVIAVGVSACARPNPLFGLAETEGTTSAGDTTTGSRGDTGRPHGGDDGARTQDDGTPSPDDSDSTTDPPPEDTSAMEDVPAVGPGEAPCCDRTPGVSGCADAQLESCVCDLDPFCCMEEWDETCVDVGIQDCGAVCFHDGSCCTPSTKRGCNEELVESCVCDIRPECCDIAYDIDCVMLADTQCVMGCFVGNNDCCTATPDEVGCNSPDVWTCVCPNDPFCCEYFWDAICVGEAVDCGVCPAPSSDADCCTVSAAGGCSDQALSPGVMNCVCDLDESCCTTGWTPACIALGEEQCTLDCV